jgi:hypothetical protein
VTCTAELAAPGTLELELGYQLRRVSADGASQHTTPILLKLPLATWIEAQVGSNGYTAAPGARYVDNLNVGAKLHLLDQAGQRPSLAVTLTASVPGVSQQGYLRAYDLFAVGHASKDYGALHVDGNVGLQVWRLEGPTATQGFAAVAASYALSGQLGVTVEPHYFTRAAPLAPRDLGAIAALTYTVRPNVVIDVAAAVVVDEQPSVAGLVGVSLAPLRAWGRGR